MQNIQHITEKNAVLVPEKDWEKLQRELTRLRRKVRKQKILRDLGQTIVEIEEDIRRPPHLRKIKQTADEFIKELRNGK